MPEQVLQKWKKSIQPQWAVCFWSALIVGLIAHFYKLTNWLPNWDSLVFRYDGQNMLTLGRWFLPAACAASSFYDLPWLNGLLAVVLHALGAVVICRTFAVRKGVTAALIGAVVVSFPSVTSVLMYSYVADGYALAFLLACLAAACLTGEKPRYLVAVVLITLSVGIYQAYITVTVMLLLCHLICRTLQREVGAGQIAAAGAKFLAVGAAGMALYYGVLTALLKLTGTELLEYQGVEGAMALSGLDLWASLYTMKHSLLGFFFGVEGGWAVFHVVNCVVFALTALLYLCDVIRSKPGIAKLLLLVLWVVLLPVGASVLALVNGGVDYHNLMKMGFCVFYLFLLLQYERTEFKAEKLNCVKQWAILLVAVVLIFNQAVLANVSYHKLQLAYEKSYGTLIRIADRIEQTDGAAGCDSILVVGSLPRSEAYSADVALDMTGTTDGLILRADDELFGQSALCSALNDYCGTDYRFLAGAEKDELMHRAGAVQMPVWPASQSVAVVDGTIILKLGQEG